jgi:hypothetical protein
MARRVDNGDDRDVGGGFNPAGLRRNMETGEMYDPGTVSNKAVATPVKPRAVTANPLPSVSEEKKSPVRAVPDSTPSAASKATESEYVPVAPERGSLRGPSAAQLREYEASLYPDESRRGRMASAPESDDVPGAAAAVARFKQETAGMSPARAQGRYPMTKRQPTANTYTRQMGAQAGEAEAYLASKAGRGAADQIPKDSSLYRNVTGGAPVTGDELSRNVNNALSALTPLGGGFGKVGAELMTRKGAAERAVKARELAEAARRAKPATTLKSSASTAPARANQAAKSGRKKFNEDEEGVIFKRGGSTKMASGGMTVSKASSRADGIAQRGKTRGKIC